MIRDGKEKEIEAADLVPGDLVRVGQGDRVPADARLIYSSGLQVDEAILTGESLPEEKSTEISPMDASLGDQRGMVFAGTLVTEGVGAVLICRTGINTELGKIADSLGLAGNEGTPLQQKIKKFSARAGVALTVMTAFIFVWGIFLGFSTLEMLMMAIAIAVSAVPEGLPIAMTVILAIGVERMAKRNGIVKKLIAAEALGSTTLILTDKTGTLTKAAVELSGVYPSAGKSENELLELALLNTDVLVENSDDTPDKWRMSGKIMEKALVRSAALRGIFAPALKKEFQTINALPFDPARKYSVSLVHREGYRLVFVGAPDVLAAGAKLSKKGKATLLNRVNELAETGELVLGVAIKKVAGNEIEQLKKNHNLDGVVFEGLISFRDPVRNNIRETIQKVTAAGIKTVIVTGDHMGTAKAVAREIGIWDGECGAIDSEELNKLPEEELMARLAELRVISRVSPTDKMGIVEAYQKAGEVVAMTGDGVNDAPSIKRADIGIAMGSGTEVARDVADLILLDDNYETIVSAVAEGRRIMGNIRKVLVYLLSGVTDELFLIGGAMLFGLPLPLGALQILWVNFFSDSFPAVAFAFEEGVDGLSERPHHSSEGLFDPLMKFLVIFIGVATSAILFVVYWVLLHLNFPADLVRTFVFMSFGTYTLFLALSLRSLEKSIFKYRLFGNRYLTAGISVGLVLMLAAVYLPFLQSLFDTVALPPIWLAGVLAVCAFNMAAVEFGKWVFRSKFRRNLERRENMTKAKLKPVKV